jgi:homoaconitate hydratase family protein/3-isopropylmalate dehydratase small subunit
MNEGILKLGDDISTDDIIPAKRCTTTDPAELANYAFEHLLKSEKLSQYEIIIAGRNFGCGSSREHAPMAIKGAGVQKVVAKSFAEIFYRNSINIGLALEVLGEEFLDPVMGEIISAGGLMAYNKRRLAGVVAVPRSYAPPRPMTVAEKILARASDNAYVRPGETVFAKVDLVMSHDAVAGPVAEVFYRTYGREARVWDPSRVVFVADHFIQVNDIREDKRAPELYKKMIQFGQEQGCRVFEMVAPGEAPGICHVLLPEQGLIRPGQVIAGTDSHSCTYGAFGAFSTGIGTTDMANLLATGDFWIQVPPTQRYILHGKVRSGIAGKDIILYILRQIGCDGARGRVMEFGGEVIDQLSMDGRMTLSNMAIEAGALCGIILPDFRTLDYLRMRTSHDLVPVYPDAGAVYEKIYEFDISNLRPQIAKPSRPDNVVDIDEIGKVFIHKAYIGSCTGGKLEDLANAAEVLKGGKVAPGVQMFIVPASQEIKEEAERLGYLEIFKEAGAILLKSGCGACMNSGIGVLGPGEVGIFATNRNFKGRSGDPTAHIYLASPRIVAFSAVKGYITAE